MADFVAVVALRASLARVQAEVDGLGPAVGRLVAARVPSAEATETYLEDFNDALGLVGEGLDGLARGERDDTEYDDVSALDDLDAGYSVEEMTAAHGAGYPALVSSARAKPPYTHLAAYAPLPA